MSYKIELTELAQTHLATWKKSGQKKSVQKILNLFEELTEHPRTGTGQVEELFDRHFHIFVKMAKFLYLCTVLQ